MWKCLIAACLAALPTGAAIAQTTDYAASALNAPAVTSYRAPTSVVEDSKASGGALIWQAAAQAAQPQSVLATLDPATIASKIVNDPSAPEVRGVKGKLIDDPQVTGGKALRVEVPRKGQNAWDISVNSALKKRVKAGDTLLLVFPARLVEGENGATSTTLPWNSVSLTSPPWSGVIGGPADIGREWKMIEVTGKADKNYAPGALAAGVQLATARQTIDLGPLIVLDLGQGQ
jgi:hypothetical protein